MNRDIQIIQANLMKSSTITESLLELAIEQDIDILLIQEPRIISTTGNNGEVSFRSINHAAYTQLLPIYHSSSTETRIQPRTMAYIKRNINIQICLRSDLCADPDCMVLQVSTAGSEFFLYNIYNQASQHGRSQPRTFERTMLYNQLLTPCIISGDFNMHHYSWDPLSTPSSEAEQFVDWTDENNLSLLNIPGKGTFFRPHMNRETVIDLTLTSVSMTERTENWGILPSIGSDHKPIMYKVRGTAIPTNLVENPSISSKFYTKQADWEKFRDNFKENLRNDPFLQSCTYQQIRKMYRENKASQQDCVFHISTTLDNIADSLTKAIQSAALASIPLIKEGAKSKPWWNPNIKSLRKDMQRKQRLCARSNQTSQKSILELEFSQSRNLYMQTIKEAKRNHWNSFLEKEDPQSIFRAMKYTKDTRVEMIPPIKCRQGILHTSFEGKCNALRKSLFPKPPTSENSIQEYNEQISRSADWPSLTQDELQLACSSKIKGKTPGPDTINQDMIIAAYEAEPDMMFEMYSLFFNIGYHPMAWRQATGAVLKKVNKPDYSIPKAYRVISLLNCLGKVLERIIARRLSILAETTDLLDHSQIGGRLRKSAVDAAMLLTNKIQQAKQVKWKTSTLFLDIKGAFDHVAMDKLLGTMQRLRLAPNLVSWVRSFLSDRQLRLSFDGQTENFQPVETGIPQGSPVSPILFLIYIRDLFREKSCLVLSYIDDISLTVSSTSLKKNIRILEKEAKSLYNLASINEIEFDLDKTELIHFTKSKDAPLSNLTLPNGIIVKPKDLVRWLGIWFDNGLTFKQHLAIRISQAKSAFYRMSRLANINSGLSPHSIRQLYLACVTSICDYGSPVWWRNQASFKNDLQKLQNLATRKILGVFRTAPTKVMEVEAAILPPNIRLDDNTRKYAIRIKSLPQQHPLWRHFNTRYLEDAVISKPTQLERAYAAIQGFWPANAEEIDHSKTKAWRITPLYKVFISNAKKEQEATAHRGITDTDRGTKTLHIYTDASGVQESKGIGVGMIVFNMYEDKIIYESRANIGTKQIVYNGEIEAIVSALEMVAKKVNFKDYSIKIFSDNQAALQRLKNYSEKPGQAQQLRAMEAAQIAKNNGFQDISLIWVPGHQHIYGNDKADALAKNGTNDPPSSQIASLSFIRQENRQLALEEWLEDYSAYKNTAVLKNGSTYAAIYNERLGRKMKFPHGIKRKISSAFFQLKIGHGYFKSYLFRIKRDSSDCCPCNNRAKQTPRHLLLECKNYNCERRQLFEDINVKRPTMSLLLHTTKGISATLKFLTKTNIATRDWYENMEA